MGWGIGGSEVEKKMWKNWREPRNLGDKKAVMVGAVPKGEAAARVSKVSQTQYCKIKPHGRGWKNTKTEARWV